MDALFQTIREAAESSTWSRGVELSRASAVTLEREDSDAITLRVTTGGGAASFAVQLYPEDEEWSCDCNSVEEVCEHVTGAAIALRSAARAGKTSRRQRPTGMWPTISNAPDLASPLSEVWSRPNGRNAAGSQPSDRRQTR